MTHVQRLKLPAGLGVSTVLPEIDFETFSVAGFRWDEDEQKWRAPLNTPKSTKPGLSAVGAAFYAGHPSTEALCFSYDLKDGVGVRRWLAGQPPPADLMAYLARFDPSEPPSYDQDGIIEAHNAMFEIRIFIQVMHDVFGWPRVDVRQFRCSMAKAVADCRPPSLEKLGEVLGVDATKDKDGKRLIQLFCVPQKPTAKRKALRVYPADQPDEAEKLYRYCDQDIVTEAACSAKLPDLRPLDLAFFLVHQECNWRGLQVDVETAEAAADILRQAFTLYDPEVAYWTNGAVSRASEVSKLQEWVSAQTGVRIAKLDDDTITELLERPEFARPVDPNLHNPARRVLEIRAMTSSASVKKVLAMARMATSAGRVHDIHRFNGARTGRDAHTDLQPGNLPKEGPNIRWCDDADCQRPYAHARGACPWCGADAAFSRETAPGTDEKGWNWRAVPYAIQVIRAKRLDWLQDYFGDAFLTITGCIRGMIIAAPGHRLICSDFSSIEAVVTAVLSGEEWRIDAFHKREDIYLHGAAGVTGTSYAEYVAWAKANGKKHPDRQKIGKPCLAAETKVLTKRGYLDIVDVQLSDELWDGVEWVSHQGLLDQGVKETLRLDGVRITPDHLVSLGSSWKEARLLASDERWLTQSLENALASLPQAGEMSGAETASTWPRLIVRAARLFTGSPRTASVRESLRAALSALSWLRRPTASFSTVIATFLRTTNTVGACSIAYRPPVPDATTTTLDSSPHTGCAASKCTSRGVMTAPNFCAMSKPSPAGITPLLKWIASTATAITNLGTSVSSQSRRTKTTNGAWLTGRPRSETSKPKSPSCTRVYDLANAGPRRRFTIRTDSGHLIVHNCELGLGFGGWLGAWRQFDKTDTFSDEQVKANIIAWREASPRVVELWGGQVRGKPWKPTSYELFGLEGMAVAALLNPGKVYDYRGIKYQVLNGSLYCTLLSGRNIAYHNAFLVKTQKFEGVTTYAIRFWGWNTNPKKGAMGWIVMETYSGQLAENVIQGTANDIMRYACVNLQAAGFPVVLRVHDEIACEIVAPPPGTEQALIEKFETIMATLPPWAEGWPIRAAGGYIAERYRKD